MTGIEGILVRTVRVGAFAAAVVALTASSAPAAPEPGCQNDSKSLGRIELSTADTPGTWWYLTRTGLDAAGVTDYLAAAKDKRAAALDLSWALINSAEFLHRH